MPSESLESKQTHLAGRLQWPGLKTTTAVQGSALAPEGRAQGAHCTAICHNLYLPGDNGLKMVFNIFDNTFSRFITRCFVHWLPAPLPFASPVIHSLLSQHSLLHLLLILILLPS